MLPGDKQHVGGAGGGWWVEGGDRRRLPFLEGAATDENEEEVFLYNGGEQHTYTVFVTTFVIHKNL